MKHKHYEVLTQWLADQTLSLEYKTSGKWFTVNPVEDNPIIDPNSEWRIRPKMVRVGRHEWPMPLDVAPAVGTEYFIALIASFARPSWAGDEKDRDRLKLGIVHLTEEAAKQHAAALVCINRGDV